MDNKTGVYAYSPGSYSLDCCGRLPLPMLGNYLLHAATEHAACRGFGFDDMMRRRTAWVLSRLTIELTHPDLLSDALRICTWVQRLERIFTFRCFEITTSEGVALGYARSAWAAIDCDTRRPTPLSNLGLEEYLVERECPVEFGSSVPAEKDTEGIPYKVKYSDLDINGHFNSIKYMESILDLFELEMYRAHPVTRFEIVYQAEGRYGMNLLLHRKQIAADEYAAAICNEGKSICRAKVQFGKMKS